MMSVTTAAIGDPGSPAMLDTRDVVEMFKRFSRTVYDDARREFYRKVNLNPFKPHSQYVLQLVEWSFLDWFSFDCRITGVEIAGIGPEGPRVELEYDALRGISPFLAAAEYLHDHDGGVGDAALGDLREVDESNFASMFWIRDANAVQGRLMVEDLIHGEFYSVFDPMAAAQYDGAHGGLIVNRIAHARGIWRSCAIPLYEARRPDAPDAKADIAKEFRNAGYTPDVAGLLRFFYGRAKDTGLGWEDTVSLRNTSVLDRFLNRVCV
ncbi:hypothetical protein [Bifidobacterium imperatoris]|nr:hypothetical protein [Bifidobacterium imperatoris]